MTYVGSNHAHDNSIPHIFLSGQAEHNAFIDSKQSVQTSDISQHHLQNRSDGDRFSGEGRRGNRAAEEALGIEEAEICSGESRQWLEIEEVDAVHDGDAGRQVIGRRHVCLITGCWLAGGALRSLMIDIFWKNLCV